MKLAGAFFVFACYLGSIQAGGPSCQTLISIIENADGNVRVLDRIKAASGLMTPKCVGELTDTGSHDTLNEFLAMRTRLWTAGTKLNEIPEGRVPHRVKPLWYAVKSSLSPFARVKSADQLRYLFNQANKIKLLLDQFGEHEEKVDFFAVELLGNVDKCIDFEVLYPQDTIPIILDMAEGPRANVESVIETARKGVLVEFTSIPKAKQGHTLAGSLGGVGALLQGADRHKMQQVRERDQLDMDNRSVPVGLKKSDDTIEVPDPANPGKNVWIPCSSVVALDIKSEAVKVKTMKSVCFNELSNKTLDALTPDDVAGVPDKHFGAMNYRTIRRLFVKGKLANISKARFAEIGKNDPLVCTAFTEDYASRINDFKDVSLSADCLLAAPGWAYLVRKMGRLTPTEFFEKIDPKAIVDNLEIVAAENQITSTQWKKVGEDMCAYLKPGMIEAYPNLQGSLPDSCFDLNPGLIIAGSTSVARRHKEAYLTRLVKSKNPVGVTAEVFNEVVKMKEKELGELTDEWCQLIEQSASKLDKKLSVLFKCSGFAFKNITDVQLEHLARQPSFCEMMRPDIVTAIGSDRFFEKVNNKCVPQLDASVMGLMTESLDIEEFPWKSVSEQQLVSLSGAVIVKALSKLPPSAVKNLSESQELAIEMDSDAKKIYDELKAKQKPADAKPESASADAKSEAAPEGAKPATAPADAPTVTPVATPAVTPAATS
ncbi:hypothetical protein PSACC_02483 [Paramicrosporidium saccamoebae]|uniref:Uncharacterized protein n=1 Tax=Paramicrosporidium saccamoebae TaxID=1246581 RepID=A0A2H9TIY8_9FUNG|nr:hypothetical protein PSACC_02483 [Paramicrosporidium saccamoebae]